MPRFSYLHTYFIFLNSKVVFQNMQLESCRERTHFVFLSFFAVLACEARYKLHFFLFVSLFSNFAIFIGLAIFKDSIEKLKQCSYLKCSYLNIGSHGNALAVSFFRRRVRLRSRAYDFHCSIEKRCGKLGRYVSFNEIHVLY